MKSEFMVAITQLSAEKNLSREVVLSAVESALISAYRKDSFAPNQNLAVKINPNSGGVKVYMKKAVVEDITDPVNELTLKDAHKIDKTARIGDVISIEATPPDAGRIAAQTARQVILQRLHEAEHHAIYEEFTCREGDVLTGTVQRITPDIIYVDLGKAEAILPVNEQIHNERYRIGQRLKFYLVEVTKTNRGPQILVSRSHRNLLRKLLELEVPEIHSGAVELKSVAREPGYRSKVAVLARQEGIDPVGCCVGLRGIRIQNIVNELNGEKIDVIEWVDNLSVLIANALSPAQVTNVELNETDLKAIVTVPDKQLSLAIGKEGQNARLAAKLTGWRIDIRSASVVEAEKSSRVKEHEAQTVATETKPTEEPEVLETQSTAEVETEFTLDEEVVEEEAREEEAVPITDFKLVLTTANAPSEQGTSIRFAEDVLPSKTGVAKKKGVKGKKDSDIKAKDQKPKKSRQKRSLYQEEEDEYGV
jgi:N utilization substance protein A